MYNYLIYHLFLVLLINLSNELQTDPSVLTQTTQDFSHLNSFKSNSEIVNHLIYSNKNRLAIQNAKNIERIKRAVTSRPERKWKNGIIPYEFEAYKFTDYQLSVFKQAMLYWENVTCIKFVERRPEDQDYVIFTERKCQCCSYIGRKGGAQVISFSINCTKFGIVLHEFGHMIGFWHEHTRPDRDENVEIIYENIQDDQEHNFGKMNKSEIDSLGSPYDYDSIMHYSRNTFTKNFYLDTVRPKYKTENEIGQRVRLSKQDIKQANLLYKCPNNGQTLERSRGVIEFNEYSDFNRIEKDQFYYEWRLVATSISEYYKLKIEELSFNFFDNFDCNENYLLILDGYKANSPVIQKICPSDAISLPLQINSKSNRVLITYKKAKKNVSGNLILKLYYEKQCGGHFTDKTGIIQSTNYPLNYSAMSSCEWTIKVDPNYKIILNFERFDLENNSNCLTDYVELRDGTDETGRLISRLCGSIIPNQIRSRTNQLFIKFVSDSIIQRYGFNATYTTDLDECELNVHNCDQLCVNTLNGFKCDCLIGFELDNDNRTCIKSCGGIIQVNENGAITSPGYPNEYVNFLNCKWQLNALPNQSIYVNFSDFDLEENGHCQSDSLTIKSKLETSSFTHGRYCGSILPVSTLSKSNVLLIDFRTDKSDTKRGFSMNYYLDQNECQVDNGKCDQFCINKINGYECKCSKGFILGPNKHTCNQSPCNHHFKIPRGTFQSIDYQNSNITNVNCHYLLETLPGHLIKIKITFNNYEQTCSPDMSDLIVYDGSTTRDRIVYKFRDNRSKILSSTRNRMLITYLSNSTCPNRGFQASYINLCGGRYTATSTQQYIYSHSEFGNSTYKPMVDCRWIIRSNSSKHVRIKFLTMSIEEKCRFDNVMIYEGVHEYSNNLIGTYCGNQRPNDTISTGNSLLIKFTTDDSRNFNGFSLVYEEVERNDLFEYLI